MPEPTTMAATAALLDAGNSIAGGVFNRRSQRKSYRMQRTLALAGHRIAARDLEKAGLNRVLSLTGPSSAGVVPPSAIPPSSDRDWET